MAAPPLTPPPPPPRSWCGCSTTNTSTFSTQELVWLLHKALEASQLEKRTCTEFLAAEGEQQRLEVLRHRERQAADLRRRLDDLTAQTEGLRRSLAEKESQVRGSHLGITPLKHGQSSQSASPSRVN